MTENLRKSIEVPIKEYPEVYSCWQRCSESSLSMGTHRKESCLSYALQLMEGDNQRHDEVVIVRRIKVPPSLAHGGWMSGILKSPNTWVLVVPVSFEIRARRQYSERARSNRASSDVQCASCFTESTSDEYTNTLACTLAPDTTVTLNRNHSLSPSFSLFECINIPKSHHFVISFMLVVNWCHPAWSIPVAD